MQIYTENEQQKAVDDRSNRGERLLLLGGRRRNLMMPFSFPSDTLTTTSIARSGSCPWHRSLSPESNCWRTSKLAFMNMVFYAAIEKTDLMKGGWSILASPSL